MLLATEIYRLASIVNCAIDWARNSDFNPILIGIRWSDLRHHWIVELIDLEIRINIKVVVENYGDGYRCKGIA